MGLRHPYHLHLGHGLTIGLTHNPVGRFLVSTAAQLIGVYHRDFLTLSQAHTHIYELESI